MPRLYTIKRADAEIAPVDQFRPEGSEHRPVTNVSLLHDGENIFGKFDVFDQYVLSVHEGFNAEVWKDSCVECFLMPNGRGYFNFEFNAGGAVRSSFIRNATRTPDGFKDFSFLPEDDLRRVAVRSSLPPRVEPEIIEPVKWTLSFQIPVGILENFSGPLRPLGGQTWRGNFFKCGDATSHPHWASWSPLCSRNFHLPESFSPLFFEP